MSFGTGPLGGGGGPFGGGGWYSPRGQYGMYPGCGCGTLFIILGGLLIAFGGCINGFRSF
jgi:hypothetical protein